MSARDFLDILRVADSLTRTPGGTLLGATPFLPLSARTASCNSHRHCTIVMGPCPVTNEDAKRHRAAAALMIMMMMVLALLMMMFMLMTIITLILRGIWQGLCQCLGLNHPRARAWGPH